MSPVELHIILVSFFGIMFASCKGGKTYLSCLLHSDCIGYLSLRQMWECKCRMSLRVRRTFLLAEGVFTAWVGSLSTGPGDKCGSFSSLPELSSNHSGGCLWWRNCAVVSFNSLSTLDDAIILVRLSLSHVQIYYIFCLHTCLLYPPLLNQSSVS